MVPIWRKIWLIALALAAGLVAGQAQIDPVPRDLVQIGYNAAFQGHQPLSAYAFLYHNQPGFLHTNLTLRLAIAPTYLDSELGIRKVFGPNTDLGVGLVGGGFADNYAEIRRGKYLPEESFQGYGGGLNVSVYHLFNPGKQIPLNGLVRGTAYYSTYAAEDDTDQDFRVPGDRGTFHTRTGLRWGGREPTLFPSLAMELSIWYDAEFRTDSEVYGFADREVSDNSHQFWGEASLAYTFPESKQSFQVSLTLGTSVGTDRFSAYRLGALLPLVSEFPLSIPGYYYQEISAERFALLTANYLLPLDEKQRWNLNLTGATAGVEYLDGMEQPGNWHSGVGGGILYRGASWRTMVGYAYGVDAIRSSGRGAHSIGVLMQLDWGQARASLFDPASPNLWRGLQQIFGLFGR